MEIVVVTIEIVVTLKAVTNQFWFAESILRNRFVTATKSFSPCAICRRVVSSIRLIATHQNRKTSFLMLTEPKLTLRFVIVCLIMQ